MHVIGLTATPPVSLPQAEAELYDALLGPVDFTVPTPAVVRDGHLAPYQELAYLTEPLPSERDWLAEHDTRFRELITTLHDDLEFPQWVIQRLTERKRSADDETELSWAEFQKRSPKLARAGVRFLGAGRIPGAPPGEAYRQPPDLDDWLVLLEDYALRCLAPQSAGKAADQYAAIAAALRELGFNLTRKGIRRGTSEVDRLLTGSQAKALALVEVLAAGARAAAARRMRALVLCDAELASQRPDDALTGVLDPAAGTARHVAAGDRQRRPHRATCARCWSPAAGCAATPTTPSVLLEALQGHRRGPLQAHRVGGARSTACWSRCSPRARSGCRAPGWSWPRALFVEGVTTCLVGTRALLGEGWNCPPLNVLVDMTIATTGVSVQQMRGRSLRLDPKDEEKVASNWDVVCVAPDLVRGSADYERFVRKHLNLFAPAEDGEVEAGPSHVHPELGPFGRRRSSASDELNRELIARATDRAAGPRALADRHALPRRRAAHPAGARPQRHRAAEAVDERPAHAASLPARPDRAPASAAASRSARSASRPSAPPLLAGLALIPAGLGWAAVRLRARQAAAPADPPARRRRPQRHRRLQGARRDERQGRRLAARSSRARPATCAASSARPRPRRASKFAAALDELVSISDNPRYLVSRPLADPRRGALGLLGRVLTRRPPFDERLHPVPADLARNKERAEVFARAWRRHVGPGRLIFTQRTDEGREARAEAASSDGGYETLVRDVWV